MTRVVVFGWGNPARADDALGLAIIDTLQCEGCVRPDWPELHLVATQQLQIEHSLDLDDCDLALFADAAVGLSTSYAFRLLHAATDNAWNTHSVEPAELLSIYEQTQGRVAPPAFLLGIRASDFTLGSSRSRSTQADLAAAMDLIRWLLTHPQASAWTEKTTGGKTLQAAVGVKTLGRL
jgi:hydrogenase maturation protease